MRYNSEGNRRYVLNSYARYEYRFTQEYFNYDHREANATRLSGMIKEKNSYYGKDFNQKEISELLGISEVTFNRIINNKFKLSFDMLIKIAWLCNCSVDEIIEFERALGNIDHLKAFLKNG